MNITLESHLKLSPLSIRQEKKHYIVEDSLSGEFYEMPKICIDAIEMIQEGQSLGEVERFLLMSYPEEDVDLLSFAEQIIDFGLVTEVDGEVMTVLKKHGKSDGFTWIPAKLGHLFFNKITNKLYIAIFIVNILLIIRNPHLFPSYKAIFLFDSMVFNVLAFTLITLLLIFIHEFGHVFAIRSYHLPAQLNIGHRLFLVVFETDLTTAWRLQSKERNILFFAGICFEQLIVFIALCLKLFVPEGNTLFIGILNIIIFDIVVKLIYQCCFYMKTDIYYFIENITGSYNLMENSKQLLRKWLPFIKADKSTTTFTEERKFVHMYSGFYVFGFILTIALFGLYFIPQAIFMYSRTFTNLFHPSSTAYFWDAIIIVVQTVLLIGMLFYSIQKNRREDIGIGE
ncbi:peptidase [Caldibacillus lycopersici]|uniref:Peptidase n=1 Tax=Perspicuibacillus lycopersici TaxID=1325689 RepID=A0AAE3IWP8_9BACI|nr:peptidase [Perspicuibacillus lycopersici]MCU9614781.1 peptidase [Perspicuibacillus lycopersici]